jgi:zinc transporter, ZIP family
VACRRVGLADAAREEDDAAVLTAVLTGLAASSALVIGALLGARWNPPKQATGVLLAFASGALISALA